MGLRMPISLVLRNPHRLDLSLSVEAEIDLSHRLPVVPRWMVQALAIDGDGVQIERGDVKSASSVEISDEAETMTLSLGALTGLLLEVDMTTGELREFEALLPSVF